MAATESTLRNRRVPAIAEDPDGSQLNAEAAAWKAEMARIRRDDRGVLRNTAAMVRNDLAPLKNECTMFAYFIGFCLLLSVALYGGVVLYQSHFPETETE